MTHTIRALFCFASFAAIAAAAPSRAQSASAVGAPASANDASVAQTAATSSSKPAAAASDNTSTIIGEVVVTAQKHETNIQSTPIAISAISGANLVARQQTDVSSVIQSLPNVHFGENEGQAQISIRGVGFDNVTVGGEGRVAFHEDGVYVSRPDAILGTIFDVNRIEVLRGPQGTLYGRNATAGAINVITNNPTDDVSGYIRATGGNYGLAKFEGALSGPLAPDLDGRIAFESIDRGGYGKDLTTGSPVSDDHEKAVRAKLRYTAPDNHVRLTLSGDYLNENDHAFSASYLGGGAFTAAGAPIEPAGLRLGGQIPNSSNPFDIDQDVNPRLLRTIYGASANAQVDVGSFVLTSISSYRHSDYVSQGDLDRTSADLSVLKLSERSDQASEEVRLNGSIDHFRFDVGGYYFHENVYGYTDIPVNDELIGGRDFFAAGYAAGGTLTTDAQAAFFNVDYSIGDVTLTAGGRYSNERKSIDEFYSLDFADPYVPGQLPPPQKGDRQAASWSDFTPLGTISYKPARNIYMYGTISTGFKSGGFNLGGLQPPFAPETLTDYEGGVKADWFDRRLQTNLSVFDYDYSNLQVNQITPLTVEIVNAAKATLKGAEADITWIPIEHLTLSADASYLSSRYDKFSTEDSTRPGLGVLNLAGNQLDQAPPYKFDLAAQYTWPVALGDLSLRGEWSGTGKTYFSPFDLNYVAQGQYSMVNAFLTLATTHHWTASLFVRNLTNTTAYSEKFISSALVGSVVNGILEPPRTFGGSVEYRF